MAPTTTWNTPPCTVTLLSLAPTAAPGRLVSYHRATWSQRNGQETDLHYWLGCANEALGQPADAHAAWQQATAGSSEPAPIFYHEQQPDNRCYPGLAWQQLGDAERTQTIFHKLLNSGQQHLHAGAAAQLRVSNSTLACPTKRLVPGWYRETTAGFGSVFRGQPHARRLRSCRSAGSCPLRLGSRFNAQVLLAA